MDRVQKAVPNPPIEGVLVCQQAPAGLEVIVGAIDDPVFGATIMFGLGGIFAEVFRDVAFRIAPLERIDAEEMIREIRGYPVLTGTRGQSARDIDRLIDLLMAVSRLVTEKPDTKELDLNPVRLFERGLMALDVRMIEKET
jgi:acyl-CoA synthetase (NDP forming)